MRQLTHMHGLSRSPVFGLHPPTRPSVHGPGPEGGTVVPVAGEGRGRFRHECSIHSLPGPVPRH